MKMRNSFLLVALVLLQYATATSIAEQINLQATNSKSMVIKQPMVPLYHESLENDQEDMEEEDAALSPSELIETHVLPEIPDSAGAAVGESGSAVDGYGVENVQRVRRRRRRRRRKRPKPITEAPPVLASSAAPVAPEKPSDSLDAYYTLPQDEIRRKPFKYREAAVEENSDTLVPPEAEAAVYGDGPNNSYPPRRVTKRRRRPFKRPIEDYPSLENGDESWINPQHNVDRPAQNSHPQHNAERPVQNSHPQNSVINNHKPTTTATTTTTTTHPTFTTTTKKPDSPKPMTTANRNKSQPSSSSLPPTTSLPPAKDDSQTPKKAPAVSIQEDVDNSLKRRKRPATAQKNQHENEIKDTPDVSPVDIQNSVSHNQQHSQVEENVVVGLKPEIHSKLVQNRKELFKPRRLPLTSAILRNNKLRSTALPTTTPKPEIVNLNNDNDDDNNDEITVTEKSQTFSLIPTSSSHVLTVVKGNHAPESHKEHYHLNTESTTSTSKFKLVKTDEKKESNDRNKTVITDNDSDQAEDDSSSETVNFPFPIISHKTLKQHVVPKAGLSLANSNMSAFLSSNDDRLAIIYVPCNQTVADNLLKNGAAFVHKADADSSKLNELPEVANNSERPENIENTESSATRKISTTRLPSGQTYSQSVKFSSETTAVSYSHENSTKASSTIKPSTTASLLSSPWSITTEKSDVTSSSTIVTTTSPYVSREAKHYQDNIAASKSKFESAKNEQTPTSSIRKPYPSPIINQAFVKPFTGSSKEIIISYTSTTNSPPSLFSYHNIDSADEQISLQLRNHNNHSGGGLHRKPFDENLLLNGAGRQHHNHQQQHHQVERKKLPLAVKSAIIISGAILALAVLGFFALLLSCKIRQAKSRMKCHRELYRNQFQSSEFRQSSRSTSPVMSKSNYNTRNFTNNMQPNPVAPNRNYYLWETLRKTFQYD